jgi:hypothetical protein
LIDVLGVLLPAPASITDIFLLDVFGAAGDPGTVGKPGVELPLVDTRLMEGVRYPKAGWTGFLGV